MIPFDARPNRITLDLNALEHNLTELRRHLAPDIGIIASVKANAYGHGIVPVAQRLSKAGTEVLATGSISDAIAMRNAGISSPILMMGGPLPAAAGELLRLDLIPTLHNEEMAEAVGACAKGPTSVYIKVDCGFGRLGVPLAEAREFVLRTARRPNLKIQGLYTHVPFTDEAGREWAKERIARFDDLVDHLRKEGLSIPVTQARASSAIVTGLQDHCTAVSPGGLLYGLLAMPASSEDGWDLRPVIREITTKLIQVSRRPSERKRRTGTPVGATGVVPFGRVDGQRPPHASEDAYMLIGDARAPILGVSLEHSILDLTEIDEAKIGDEVTVVGKQNSEAVTVHDLARWQHSTINDVLINLGGGIIEASYR